MENIKSNDHLPNQLLACSGIHLSVLPKQANTITAILPQMPTPSKIYPVALIIVTKCFMSGPQHKKNSITKINEARLPIKLSVKKN